MHLYVARQVLKTCRTAREGQQVLVFGEGRRTPAKPRLHMTDADPNADRDRDEPRMRTVEGPLGRVILGPDPDAFARWEAKNHD